MGDTSFFEAAENKDVVTGQNNLHLATNLHLTESGRNHLVRRGWLLPSSRPRSPPSARDRSCPGARDKSSLCVSALLAGRCRLFGPRSVGGSRSHAKPTPKWRPRPAGCRRREISLQQQLPVFFRPLKRASGPSPNLARRCSWKPVLHPLDTPARPRSPLQIPCGSRPRLSNTLLCDGHRSQAGGHKNNGGQKGARANGDGAKGPLGRVRNPSWRRGGPAMLSTGRKLAGHSENGLVPVPWDSNRAITLSHENARGLQ